MGELIFVGLGLGGVDDLSARAMRALRECDQVFGEFYTSKLIDSTPDDLEKAIGKSIVRLKRREVEEEETVIEAARNARVAFVTAGDTMAATTHVDLKIRPWRRAYRRPFSTASPSSPPAPPRWGFSLTSSDAR
jgi:diphthine synthase